MTTIQEFRKMNAKDLVIELTKARAELGKTLFAVRAGHEAGSHKVSAMRQKIAHIRTVQTEQGPQL